MEHILRWGVLAMMALAAIACAPDEQPETALPAAAPAMDEGLKSLRKPAPDGAVAYIISPRHGARVTSPVRILFGLKGIGVAPAGVDAPNTGHHHLLVDAELTNPNVPLPNDGQHLHFGSGQTEVLLPLAPGNHRLQLVLGDYLHIPHEPPIMSEPITIEVITEG